jgi:hypothetical protein
VLVGGRGLVDPSAVPGRRVPARMSRWEPPSPRHTRSEIAVVRVGTGNSPRTDIVLIGSDGGLRRVLVGASGNFFLGVAVDRAAWSPGRKRCATAVRGSGPSARA